MDEPTRAPATRASRRRSVLLVAVAIAFGVAGLAAWQVWLGWPDDPERLSQQARAAWSAGRLEEAEAILARLVRLRPASVAERLLRAQVARERGRIDQALAALDGFPAADPGAALIERSRGMLELERDRARPAEEALLRALSLDPKLAEARRDLVNLYTIQSRRRELSEQLRALASAGPLGFEELYLWCLGRRADIGPAGLSAKLEKMLESDSDDRTSRLALAEDLRRLGRLPEAESALARLPSSDPDARAARVRLALDGGRMDVAADLLADGPADHPALSRLRGRLALARGDATAVTHYRTALASDPDDRDALFGLGQALRVAGKPEAAAPYLQAARDRDHLEWLIENARSLSRRDDARSLRAIGDACRSLRRLAEARAWYRLALARDPLDAGVQKSLFDLDSNFAPRSDPEDPPPQTGRPDGSARTRLSPTGTPRPHSLLTLLRRLACLDSWQASLVFAQIGPPPLTKGFHDDWGGTL